MPLYNENVKKNFVKLNKKKNRSGNGLCDICKQPHILESHHIDGRNVENPHISANIISICANCHNNIHYGKIIIEGWAMSTTGRELFWHINGEEPTTDRTSNPYIVPN